MLFNNRFGRLGYDDGLIIGMVCACIFFAIILFGCSSDVEATPTPPPGGIASGSPSAIWYYNGVPVALRYTDGVNTCYQSTQAGVDCVAALFDPPANGISSNPPDRVWYYNGDLFAIVISDSLARCYISTINGIDCIVRGVKGVNN